MPGGNAMGPRDQREVELRDDVLVYSTPVLDRPVGVTGPIELCLFVASSTRDTDFTGKLVDVYPDGRAIASGWRFPAVASSASTTTVTPAGILSTKPPLNANRLSIAFSIDVAHPSRLILPIIER